MPKPLLQRARKRFDCRRHWIPHVVVWLSVALLIAAAWLHTDTLIDTDRARTITETEQQLGNLTRVTQEHAARTFRSADQALLFVKARYEEIGARLDLKALTEQGVIDADIFNQVSIIDAHGMAQLSSHPIKHPLDLSDRAHFKAHLTQDTKKLFISQPLIGRLSGKWSIQLSRRINRKDGSFGGVAVVSLDPRYFTRFYGDLDLGPRGTTALFGLDGIIIARRAGRNEDFGIDASSATLFSHIARGDDSGTFDVRSVVDGIDRTMFFRLVTPYPIAVTAGIASTDVFSDYLRTRDALLLQVSLLSLLMLALGTAFSLHHRQMLRGIAQQKRTSEQLAESEQRMELALNGADLGLWDWHIPSGKFTINARMAALLGYTDDTPEPNSPLFAALLHPDDWHKIKAALHPHLKGETPIFEVKHRLRHKDRHWVWLLARGKVMQRDQDGRAVRMVGTDLDITDSAMAEQQVRVAAAAFESQEGMFVTDEHKVIQRVNRAFTEITGYRADEAVGQTPKLLSSGRHDAAFYAAMSESIKHADTWQGEIWNRRKNGEVYPQWLTITAVKNPAAGVNQEVSQGVTHYVSTLTDITLRKMAENKIRDLAFFDPLTRLPNRRLLLDRMHQALITSKRNGHEVALLFIDLDNFKTLNDTLGHDKGDLLLQQAAQRLTNCVRESDTVARLGGDEFVVMLEDLSALQHEAAIQAKNVGEKILAALDLAYLLAGHVYRSTASIGISLLNHDRTGVEELLKQADLALYEAKAAGRNTLRFFDHDMQAMAVARAAMESDLRAALQNKQFELHYQALVDEAGRLTGAEALLRWQHPVRGLVSPAEFIALAEATGLILPLDQWVLETACAQLGIWSRQKELAHLTLAINVSARQLHQPDFVAQVFSALERGGANPEKLKLELTESLLLKDEKGSAGKMRLLSARGVQFALDDFGTGHSSLSFLKRLPLDQLKIDRSFVCDALTDPDNAAIASTIVAMARSLGLGVIAEGVETEAQRHFLAGIGCLAYQGYLFGRPSTLAQFEQYCRRQKEASSD